MDIAGTDVGKKIKTRSQIAHFELKQIIIHFTHPNLPKCLLANKVIMPIGIRAIFTIVLSVFLEKS